MDFYFFIDCEASKSKNNHKLGCKSRTGCTMRAKMSSNWENLAQNGPFFFEKFVKKMLLSLYRNGFSLFFID